MKIGVVGAGAVGSFYGAKLWRDGHEVHFLLRSDYEAVRRSGVQIKSPDGNFRANPRAARTAAEIGPCDLVLIALKTTANDQLADLVAPLVGPQAAIMTLQNGLGNEELLAATFGAERILGGLCFVCLNRTAPGVIEHLAHGKIMMGEFSGWPEPRTHDIATAFKRAGIPVIVADNLACAHWEKLVWNIPFNGLGVASCAGIEVMNQTEAPPKVLTPQGPCLTTDLLIKDEAWLRWVRGLMREVIGAAQKKGLKVADSAEEEQVGKTRIMGPYKPSTLLDFERGQPLELETLFLEPLRQARAAGAKTPFLERLCAVLEGLQPPTTPA